jgi:hypothetical protein
MSRTSRFLGSLMLVVTLAFVWPADALAQRGGPRGGSGAAPRSAPRGGGATVGVAVPRGTYHGGGYYRPAPYRSYGYYPRYYYPYAYYPRYYAYPYYAYPYYSAPFSWGFGFGIGFGFGWSGGSYFGAYGYPYGYAYPYAAPPYPYYYRPYGAGYYGSSNYGSGYYGSGNYGSGNYGSNYSEPSAQMTVTSRAAQPYADAQAYMQRPASSNGTSERAGFATLSLRVTPADAEIVIDGDVWDRPAGENRFSIDLAEGSHVIEVRKDGYGSYSRRIDVVRGQPLTLNVGLTPRGPVPVRYNNPYSAGATLVRR